MQEKADKDGEMTAAGKLFFGGMPTEPDARKIVEVILKLEPGAVAPYSDLEAATGIKRGTHRFATVLSAAKRTLLRDHNVRVVAARSEGLKRLKEDQRISVAAQEFGGAAKRIRRATIEASRIRTERLSVEDANVVTHARRVMEATCSALRDSSNQIVKLLDSKPTETLPRVIPKIG